MSYSSSRVRKEWTASDDLRDAGLTTPDAVIRYDDISYGPDPMNVLDVYRPKDAQGSLPVFVLVHGGGWVYGDKERYQYYGLTMAERGFTVINYTYRLAPEYKFPASLEDTCLAIRWMFENKQKYGLDTEHVFLGGDSAGAHLAGLFTNLCTSPEYAAHFSFRAPEGFVPNAVALNCGVYAPARGIDELMNYPQPTIVGWSFHAGTFPCQSLGGSLTRSSQHMACPRRLYPIRFRLGLPFSGCLPHH